MYDEPMQEIKHKRCDWLFNTGFTLVVIYTSFVTWSLDSVKNAGVYGGENISQLPWVHGSEIAEMFTTLILLALLLFLLSFVIWQTWNRLVLRFLKIPDISLGEAYAIILWVLLIAVMMN